MDKQTIETLKAAVQTIEDGTTDAFAYEAHLITGGWAKKDGVVSAVIAAMEGYQLRLPRKTVTVTLPECVPNGWGLTVLAPDDMTTLKFATEAERDEACTVLKGLAK